MPAPKTDRPVLMANVPESWCRTTLGPSFLSPRTMVTLMSPLVPQLSGSLLWNVPVMTTWGPSHDATALCPVTQAEALTAVATTNVPVSRAVATRRPTSRLTILPPRRFGRRRAFRYLMSSIAVLLRASCSWQLPGLPACRVAINS